MPWGGQELVFSPEGQSPKDLHWSRASGNDPLETRWGARRREVRERKEERGGGETLEKRITPKLFWPLPNLHTFAHAVPWCLLLPHFCPVCLATPWSSFRSPGGSYASVTQQLMIPSLHSLWLRTWMYVISGSKDPSVSLPA